MGFTRTQELWTDWKICESCRSILRASGISHITQPVGDLWRALTSLQAYINHFGMKYVEAQALSIEIPISSCKRSSSPAPLWAIWQEPNISVLSAELSSSIGVLRELQLVDEHPTLEAALLVLLSVRGYLSHLLIRACNMTRFHFPPHRKQFVFRKLTSLVAMARKVIAVLSLNVKSLDRVSCPNPCFISFDHCCSQWCVLQSAIECIALWLWAKSHLHSLCGSQSELESNTISRIQSRILLRFLYQHASTITFVISSVFVCSSHGPKFICGVAK